MRVLLYCGVSCVTFLELCANCFYTQSLPRSRFADELKFLILFGIVIPHVIS